MIARLLKADDEIILVLKSGEVVPLDEAGIKDFYLNADRYLQKSNNIISLSSMLDLSQKVGSTLAYLDDHNNLVITDIPFYRNIMTKLTDYLTADEYGELHGKKRGIILRLCRERRLPGSIKKGEVWLIPRDCPYPKDARVGTRVEPLY